MKKGRKIKFTLGMKIASILCCVALVSVGFAAWWIVEFPVAQKTEDGNFTVYSVESKKIIISEPTFLESDNANIIYGHPSETPVPNYGWLGYTSVDPEDLTATLQFSVSIDSVGDTLNTYLNTINVVLDTKDTAFDSIIGKGVAAPKAIYRLSTDGTFDEEAWVGSKNDPAATYIDSKLSITLDDDDMQAQTLYVQVQFIFGWHYKTGTPATDKYDNPYSYYNTQTYSDALADELANNNAEDDIGILENINKLATAKYNITISTDPAGSETTAAPTN